MTLPGGEVAVGHQVAARARPQGAQPDLWSGGPVVGPPGGLGLGGAGPDEFSLVAADPDDAPGDLIYLAVSAPPGVVAALGRDRAHHRLSWSMWWAPRWNS